MVIYVPSFIPVRRMTMRMDDTWMRLQDAGGVLPNPDDDLSDPARKKWETDYHWTPASQRAFLEALATTGSVTRAAKEVYKSPRAAYGLKFRRHGFAFRVAWDASLLVARDVLADMLMDRAVNGFEEVTYKDDEGARVRGRFDNGLSSRVLGRLDDMVARQSCGDAMAGAYQAKVHLAVSDYEAFLDLIENGGGHDEAEAFFAARQQVCDTQQLDSEIQAAECELARNSAVSAAAKKAEIAQQNDPEAASRRLSVWFDNHIVKWMTDFPPPPIVPTPDGNRIGQIVKQWGAFGTDDYRRTLTNAEIAAHEGRFTAAESPMIGAAHKAREAWFGSGAVQGAACEVEVPSR
jgi:hypothetical protein